MKKILKLDFLIALGGNVRRIRMSQGITQRMLAIDCDIEPASLNRIEQGKVNTSVYTLRQICVSLGVQSSLLMRM